MKFSIGTASSSLEFEEDMRLIKSSLLYADEIELIGMAEYAVFTYLPRGITEKRDIQKLINNFVILLQAFENEESAQLVMELEKIKNELVPILPMINKKKGRNKDEILAQMQMKQLLKQCREQLNDGVNDLLNTTGATAIQKLVDKRIVSIYDYSYNGFSLDELTGGFFANLLGTIKQGKSYPLFDKISADVVRSVIDNDILDFSNIDKEIIRHAGIANSILMTLPTLDNASVDEILDFKKDLQIPLSNFRRAIYNFSETISSMPWDKDFDYECIKLYETEVVPRVNEINELSSETSILKNFGTRVLADQEERRKLGFAGAGLIATVTTQSNMFDALGYLEQIIRSGAKVGLTVAGIEAFLKTMDVLKKSHDDVKEKKKIQNNNTMYYYYKAYKKI